LGGEPSWIFEEAVEAAGGKGGRLVRVPSSLQKVVSLPEEGNLSTMRCQVRRSSV